MWQVSFNISMVYPGFIECGSVTQYLHRTSLDLFGCQTSVSVAIQGCRPIRAQDQLVRRQITLTTLTYMAKVIPKTNGIVPFDGVIRTSQIKFLQLPDIIVKSSRLLFVSLCHYIWTYSNSV